MSDRRQLFNLPTGDGEALVELWMDGDSGTWRLFVHQEGDRDNNCVDFSLEGLRQFHVTLGTVLRDVESDPEGCNAEVRAKWEV